ncbi:MAG: hypothetical protein HOP12_04395 [Candidatus Eisenbacteria bacterium]|uniref:Uncharacterized protein n=1 Tax=Eiseniibacteriota bacterium TaxID=2212470 RepID=A0A849SIH1_UNCEI|nr:hypothetical protein [Candidatus Eisenbacteria bacterium]
MSTEAPVAPTPATPSSAPASALTGSIPRALLTLAIPVLISQFLRLGYQWVDALWVRGSASTRPLRSPVRSSCCGW